MSGTKKLVTLHGRMQIGELGGGPAANVIAGGVFGVKK